MIASYLLSKHINDTPFKNYFVIALECAIYIFFIL